jgi:hypothetical protein
MPVSRLRVEASNSRTNVYGMGEVYRIGKDVFGGGL